MVNMNVQKLSFVIFVLAIKQQISAVRNLSQNLLHKTGKIMCLSILIIYVVWKLLCYKSVKM